MILLSLLGWTVLGPNGKPTARQLDAKEVFQPAVVGPLTTHPDRLATVAANAAQFISDHPKDEACTGGMFTELGVSAERTRETLEFVAKVARETPDSLSDPTFIAENFDVWRWTPDLEPMRAARLKTGQGLRLTKYLVYESAGSPVKTEQFDTALYAAPTDPAHRKLTRMAVYAGAYESGEAKGGAEPLVWMSRRDVNRALMQGSVWVKMLDGSVKLYNVHVNNGIKYERSIKDGNKQGRYWYFQTVEHVRGYGRKAEKVRLEPHVAVAGDVYNLGVGRVIAVSDGDQTRLAIVADTGGAFSPNLFQLDWYSGPYASHEAFEKGTAHLPMYVDAYVLVKKP